MDNALLLLLHVLILVCWLGGNLDAFVAPFLTSNPNKDHNVPLVAAGLRGDAAIVPRTELVMTVPTDFTLTVLRGRLPRDPVCLIHVGISWPIDLAHGGAGALGNVDVAFRWLAAGALGVAGGMGLTVALGLPLITQMLMILAAYILTGLLVRRLISDLSPAMKGLAAGQPTRASHGRWQ